MKTALLSIQRIPKHFGPPGQTFEFRSGNVVDSRPDPNNLMGVKFHPLSVRVQAVWPARTNLRVQRIPKHFGPPGQTFEFRSGNVVDSRPDHNNLMGVKFHAFLSIQRIPKHFGPSHSGPVSFSSETKIIATKLKTAET
ncbi:hypothetical protein AVEN_22180-1 [Araneus ventricosus]|uniref:Uncharacterized protein n=1 Tax=Araneus ventricosus TaxID=182803 RepID=A0A4Y2K796_ARAVE|nr:hypothetical protein AVEN_22180-1 [Araneus ventricosus]